MTAREAVAHIRSIAQRVTGSAEDFVCSCLCPDHGQGKGDRSPSLSVRYDGSRALLHCFVGCTVEAIVSAAGLQMRDLFDGPGDGRASKDKRDMLRTYLRSRTWICSGPDGASYQHHRLDHVWYDARHYERAVRWWQRGAKAKRLMYRAGDVDSSRIVFVEGEPAADALAAISEGVKVLATVCGAPTLPDPDVLAWHVGDGPHAVLLWPDGDPVGREHMRGIQAMLPGSRIIDTSRLPGRVEADKPGADAADWTGHELTPGAVWGALLEASVAALPEAAEPDEPEQPEMPAELAGRLPDDLDGDDPDESESQLAIRAARAMRGELLHVAEERTWWIFDRVNGWSHLPTQRLLAGLARMGRACYGARNKQGDLVLSVRSGGAAARAHGVATLLSGHVPSPAAEWDADPRLVGLPGARVVDLRTSDIRALQPADRIRHHLSVMPAKDGAYGASTWRLVVESLIPDPAVRLWLQVRLGAALARAEGLDTLIWLHGPPAAGKGTLLLALVLAFGSYAGSVPAQELITGGRRAHSAWLYRIRRCRLLVCDDAPARDLDRDVITRLLGSLVDAQPMRGDTVQFRLVAPLLATSNYAPSVPAADGGLLRRLHPIQVEPAAGSDPAVRARMASPGEQSVVLSWLVAGMRAYEQHGLQTPDSIRAAAQQAMDDSPMTEFVSRYPSGSVIAAARLWQDWKAWKAERREQPGSQHSLGRRLRADYGWKATRTAHERQWTVT